ncbi:hypothetical protein [Stutzerimonas stutzeri]|uniref:hypothetical protein n=1 Tax=Stutzerimonas stutzeri TaxID=316 RepID=UPI001BD6B2CE|nr:hypothetical protein [Stutzerimonas stutzeri]MBS9723816.1 hypothetical protein [Stutzerimonas stutzeri]
MAYHSIEQLRYPSEPLNRVIYGYTCTCGAKESFLVSKTPQIAVALELTESGYLGLVEYSCQNGAYVAQASELKKIARCFECNEKSLKLTSVTNIC